MTDTPMGERVSAPSPTPKATGSMPKTMAKVVIRMGLSLTGPASRMASRRLTPRARKVLV